MTSFGLALFLSAPLRCAEQLVGSFPPAADSALWTSLLQKFVDERGLVAYGRWKADVSRRAELRRYLATFALPGGAPSPEEKTAILINAYNAFIVETVLDHYPVDGIRSIPGAFSARVHKIAGREYSLDEIEHSAIRLAGFRAHAAMVCASRSCPPLDRRAYDARDLSARLDDRMRAWLARADLYRFDPAENLARLPKYFDWYRADFEKEGIARVLSTYAPAPWRDWLSRGTFRIEYLEYDWSLNDRDRPR